MSSTRRQTRSSVVPPGATVMKFGGTKSRPLKQVVVMPPKAYAPHKVPQIQLNIAGRQTRPPYLDMVKLAISSHKLHMIHGVSYQAISTYILQNFPTNPQNFRRFLRVTCARAVANGQLEKVGNKYKYTRTEFEKDKQKAQRAAGRSKTGSAKTRPVAGAKKRSTRAAAAASSGRSSSAATATQASTKRKRAASSSARAQPVAKKMQPPPAKKARTTKAAAQQEQNEQAPQLQRVRSGSFKPNEVVGNNMKWSWQYYDNGWFNYDPAASDIVEANYQDYLKNPGHSDVRAVHSGHWNYMVDFRQMMQQNIQHENHTRRKIRRVQLPIAEINNRNRYADSMDSSDSESSSSEDSE